MSDDNSQSTPVNRLKDSDSAITREAVERRLVVLRAAREQTAAQLLRIDGAIADYQHLLDGD